MKIVVIDTGIDDEYIRKISLKYKNADIKVLSLDVTKTSELKNVENLTFKYNGISTFAEIRKNIIKEKFDKAIIPSENNTSMFRKIIFSKLFLFLTECNIPEIVFFNGKKFESKYRSDFWKNIIWLSIYFIFAPLISIITLPFYLITQLFPALLRIDKEFIGFKFTYLGAHYFYSGKAKMAKKFGLFGIDHEDFLGTPVTLHRSPLEIFLLQKLGFTKFILFSLSIIAIPLAIIAKDNSVAMLILIPLILFCTFFVKSIILGHTEFLGWGLLLTSIYLYLSGNIVLSAVFFGLTLLSHINIAIIGFITIVSIATTNIIITQEFWQIFSNMLIYGVIVLCITGFFIIPFIRTLNKLSRDKILNNNTGWNKRLNPFALAKALLYLPLMLYCLLAFKFDSVSILIIIPFIILVFNTRIKWIFSEYTLELSNVLFPAVFIFYHPNAINILLFLYFIYSTPMIISPLFSSSKISSYELKEIKYDTFKKKLLTKLKKLPAHSRIALEDYPRNSRTKTDYFNSFLSYIFIETDLELLNGFGVEFVEYDIYSKYIQFINAHSDIKKLKSIFSETGCKYVIAYDDAFRKKLTKCGFKEIFSIDTDSISEHKAISIRTVTLFKNNEETELIEPKTTLNIRPNHIEIDAKANMEYLLKYSYFPGWRATQNNNKLIIKDAHPGMIIKSKENKKIIIEYKYRNYWS